MTANGAFALLAVSVAAMAFVELNMVRAQTPASSAAGSGGTTFRSGALSSPSSSSFACTCGRGARGWDGRRSDCARCPSSSICSSPNINYRELTGLEHVTVLGESLAQGQGTTNPLLAIAQLSLVVLIVYVGDAAIAPGDAACGDAR